MTAARYAQFSMVLRTTSVVALAAALVALLWRPALDAEMPDESTGALAADSGAGFPAPNPARAADAQRIISNNLFAATRQAPSRRYAPGSETTAQASPDFAAGADPTAGFDVPVLLGTAIDAVGARALLQATANDSAAHFYRVGERVGAYRVRRIEAGRVVLSGPSGRLILELSKPNEGRP